MALVGIADSSSQASPLSVSGPGAPWTRARARTTPCLILLVIGLPHRGPTSCLPWHGHPTEGDKLLVRGSFGAGLSLKASSAGSSTLAEIYPHTLALGI